MTAYDAFFRYRFQKPPFSPVYARNEAFPKASTLETTFKSVGCVSVDDKRKCYKKYVFLNKNALVRPGTELNVREDWQFISETGKRK